MPAVCSHAQDHLLTDVHLVRRERGAHERRRVRWLVDAQLFRVARLLWLLLLVGVVVEWAIEVETRWKRRISTEHPERIEAALWHWPARARAAGNDLDLNRCALRALAADEHARWSDAERTRFARGYVPGQR